MLESYLLFLLSHLLGDFVFQTKEIINKKADNQVKGCLIHSGIFFITMVILFKIANINLRLFNISNMGIIILGILHFIIDYIKLEIEKKIWKKKKGYKIVTFFCDQALHLLMGYFVIKCSLIESNMLFFSNNILVKSIVFVFITFTGAVLVKLILDYIYREKENYQEILAKVVQENKEENLLSEINIGKVIGILERGILFMLIILTNEYSALGFIFLAKTLTRFKMIDNKSFAEYYLLGTLISYAVVIGGIILEKNLLGILKNIF